MHCLGFTEGHDAALLVQLAAGGMYYFLSTGTDIVASVGDCLGADSTPLPATIQVDTSIYIMFCTVIY